MKYDVLKEREETLKASKRAERNTCAMVIVFIALIYVGISCGAYHKKHPHLSVVDVVVEHFFDAVMWNHEVNEVNKSK